MNDFAAALLTQKTDNLLVQLIRYTFVGGFAFVVDFGSLYLLTEFLGLHYLVSAALAFLLGMTTNYLISTAWVFNNRNVKNRRVEFLVFAAIGIVGLGLNEVFIWFFTERIDLHYMLSKAISAVLIYLWNFFARKLILFR